MVDLFLMTYKGFFVLDKIIRNNLQVLISNVIIGQDVNIENDFSREIVELCKTHKVSFRFRKKKDEFKSKFGIAISWRWLIPISKDERQKLIVLHDSLLPRYRGFAPLVNQLINEEKIIGVTALFATEEYDKGEIIGQSKVEIEYPIKINEAIEKTTPLYAKLALNILQCLKSQEQIVTTPQDERQASYSLWRDEEDYRIDWNKSSEYIKRFIDSVGPPYRGAYCYLNNKKIRVYDANIIEDLKIENRDSGKVIFHKEGKPIVVCKTGLLKISEAKYERNGEDIFPLKRFRSRFH